MGSIRFNIVLGLCACVAIGGMMSAFAPIDGTFSYQGRLTNSGTAITGTADLKFRLYDDSAAGAQVGSEIELIAVSVAGGLFNVDLDFGVAAFDGDQRWLEIDARSPAGVGGYTTLTPRQPLLGTPYSIQTRGLFVDDALNVGIGTTTPDADLEIEADYAKLRLTANNTSPISSAALQLKGSAGTSSFHPLGSIEFFDNTDTLRAVITGGKLGSTNAQFNFNVTPYETGQLRITRNSIQMRDEIELFRGTDLATAAVIGSDGADSYFQLQGGKVGIGTDTPGTQLDIIAPNGVSGVRAVCTNPGGGSGAAVHGEIEDSNDGTWYAGRFINRQEVSGVLNYGVFGHTTASSGSGIGVYGKSDSSSASAVGVWGEALNGSGRGVEGAGGAYDFNAIGSGINYGATSSRRWKSNIENIDNPLEKIARLRGVYFDWDEEHGGHHDIGMIAEEVGAVLPEIVNYEKNGVDADGMDYSKMTPLLVEAVNALRAEKDEQIESLRAENESRRARLESLENRLDAMASPHNGRN